MGLRFLPFYLYSSILADWVELVRHLYLIWSQGVKWFGGLTGFEA